MDKQYYVYFKEDYDFSELKELLSSYFAVDNIRKVSNKSISFIADDILKSTISKSIHTLCNDLSNSLLVLMCPIDIPFSEYVLMKLSSYHSEGVFSLSQGVIELLMKQDEIMKNHLFSFFSGMEYTLAISGKTYIEYGYSIKKSCECLSVHRNTMEYRLKKIKETFGLDLTSFDDSILFLTYLYLSGICA